MTVLRCAECHEPINDRDVRNAERQPVALKRFVPDPAAPAGFREEAVPGTFHRRCADAASARMKTHSERKKPRQPVKADGA